MNILLLCSSLEPGRDGVGDYTRRLGVALKAMGFTVHAVAIHDRQITGSSTEIDEIQKTSEGELHVWRLNANRPWPKRIAALQDLVRQIEPDWISLQFVPYGFHDKGVPLGLPYRLSHLVDHGNWHIMFHELWVGPAGGVTRKQLILRWLQKRVVSSLRRQIRPPLVTSHTDLYLTELSRRFSKVRKLPLFGNIPNAGSEEDGRALLRKAGLACEDFQIAVVFGSVHPAWNPLPFVQKWRSGSKDKAPALVFLGRGFQPDGPHRELAASLAPLVRVVRLGERSESEVASVLQASDFGIATTPLVLIEKSGTAASFRDFGLPVVVTREDPLCADVPGHLRASALDSQAIQELRRDRLATPSLPNVAAQFVSLLNEKVA